MNKQLHMILTLTSVVLFASCDKRKDAIEKFNIPPKIYFEHQNGSLQLGNTITDSLKLNQNGQASQNTKPNHEGLNTKAIVLKYGSQNISSIKFTSSSRNAKIFHQGRRMIDLLPVNRDELKLNFENDTEELTTLEFNITDKLNATSKVVYNIFSFINLAPIASLEYRQSNLTSNFEYELDASKSFDEDRNQGGAVEWYIFHVDAHEIKAKANKIHYVFKNPGTYPVDLTVIDNQGKSSKVVSKSITINSEGQ